MYYLCLKKSVADLSNGGSSIFENKIDVDVTKNVSIDIFIRDRFNGR